jgi:hypothetical protein
MVSATKDSDTETDSTEIEIASRSKGTPEFNRKYFNPKSSADGSLKGQCHV